MESTDGFTEKLTIGQKEFDVMNMTLKVCELKFYDKNPRIYNTLNTNGNVPDQIEIEEYMTRQEHVKQLKSSIESNGGLIDPLIVRGGDNIVLEGNSRLAAYRLLNKIDPIKWGIVKCKILPSDIDDNAIFTLLGQYHIIGRKDWDAFEQANYLYRRHKETKTPFETMAEELGITKGDVERMINVITFMIQNNDLDNHRWSYYEEYLKNSGIKNYKKNNPESKIDERVVIAVKNGDIEAAADIRKLGTMAKMTSKVAKKNMDSFLNGNESLYTAYQNIQDSGDLDFELTYLKKVREKINDPDFEKGILENTKKVDALSFEIKKLITRLTSIQAKLGK